MMHLLMWGELLFLCAGLPEGAEGGPTTALTVDAASIDFGEISRFAVRERTLLVNNHSGRPVTLRDSDSDCVCLHSEIPHRRLEPSESTPWHVVLNACDYTGEVRRHVWLKTDSPAVGLKVAVRYRVVPELFTEPFMVGLGFLPVESADSVEASVDLRTITEETFQLLGAWSNDPAVEVIIEEEYVARDDPGRVRVRVYLPVPEGRYQSTVWIATDSVEVPKLRIPLVGESIAGLRCDRREIVFEDVVLGEAQTRTVTFSHDASMRIGEVRKSNETLDITEIKRSPGRVTATLKTRKRLQLGGFRGYLTVNVNDGRARKVKLPYRGNVLERDPAALTSGSHETKRRTEAAKIAIESREE